MGRQKDYKIKPITSQPHFRQKPLQIIRNSYETIALVRSLQIHLPDGAAILEAAVVQLQHKRQDS